MGNNNNFDLNVSMSLSEGVSDEEASRKEETENSTFTGTNNFTSEEFSQEHAEDIPIIFDTSELSSSESL
uniref:Uncharacterized protein n=1 Tax=Daucus carota subsp. sativus TaxID=79200 RepID=A0A161YIW2_DAUCS